MRTNARAGAVVTAIAALGLLAAAERGHGDDVATSSKGAQTISASVAIDSENIMWRSERVCGVNCLYFIMRSLGQRPDYLALQQELLGERLTSLLDLKRSAAARNIVLNVVKLTPSGLQHVPKPVIAHFDVVDIHHQTSGHFVVVTAADADGVQFVDGSTAESIKTTWRDFQRDWSGYSAYVTVDTVPWTFTVVALMSGLCGGWLLDCVWQQFSGRGLTRTQPSSRETEPCKS